MALQVVDGNRREDPKPGAFFEGQTFVPPILGAYLKDEAHFRLGIDGRLYRWRDGHYVADGDAHARARTRDVLKKTYRKRHGEEVVAWLHAEEPTIGTDHPADLLNVTNGLLDWQTGDLAEHSPAHLSTIRIPHRWIPGARCQRIEQFLGDVLPADAHALVFELMGYALLPRNPLHVALLALGPGANGKSVLLGLFRTLAGIANVAAVPLQKFGEDRFAAAELVGKLVNICGDLDARAIKNTDTFKMATGGDLVYAERKHRDPFQFIPFALPIFSANEPPFSSDQSPAWFRRWVVLPMEAEVPEDCRDPLLLEKLTETAEMEGLLFAAVEALGRLMRRRRFELPASVAEAGEQYRERLDSVCGFLGGEAARFDPTAWTARRPLYKAYAEWCREQGRHALSATTFYARLRDGFPEQLEERKRGGTRGFVGVTLIGGQR